jgi:PAS domain S-box-containing protein
MTVAGERTKEELFAELEQLRQRVAELEALAVGRQTVEDELRKLSRAVEQSPSTVVITDIQGNIEYANPKFTELTGYQIDEVLGRNPRLLKSGRQSAEFYQDLWDTILSGREWRGEFCNKRRGGGLYWELASISPVRNAEGRITHFIKVGEDITERKRAEDALRQRTLELQARNEELDAFAHTVAHDLKNPLGLIMGFAEVVEDRHATMSPQELQKHLHSIGRNARKMSNIIDELLLLAGVRKMDIQVEPLDMAAILDQAQERLADMIEQYEAEIALPSEAAWPEALGYGPWVEEVWVNYLSNAIKYGGQPPRIELGAATQPDGMVRFWVRDNGPGLTSEEQAQLFVPFTQLAQIRVEGYGLGLSIVRRIVAKLGGQVGVESDGVPGLGSTFHFTLTGTGHRPPGSEGEGGGSSRE